MHLLVSIAGIPDRIFDEIRRTKGRELIGDNASILKFRIERDIRREYRYTPQHISEIQRGIEAAAHTMLFGADRTKFSLLVVYVDYPGSDLILDSLFPYTLTAAIPQIDFPAGVESAINLKIAKGFRKSLRATVARVRGTLDAIRDEVVGAQNRTPVLLPLHNFQVSNLRDEMVALCRRLGQHNDAHAQLIAFRHDLTTRYCKDVKKMGQGRYFVDDRNVVFRAPPPSGWHGFAQSSEGHRPSCWLGGNLRLGAPYNPSFHYDCGRASGKRFVGSLSSCHGQKESVANRKNVNIAPNDHIR